MKQSQQRRVLAQAIEAKVHRLDLDALLKLAAELKVPVPADVSQLRSRKDASAAAATPCDPAERVLAGKGIGQVIPAADGARKLEKFTIDEDSADWAESELLGAGEVVQRLGISRGTLDNWRKANKVIALRKGFRNYVYPFRQFERRKPVDGLDRLASLFSSPEEMWEWLVTPNRMTDETAPIDKLRDGDLDMVISAAEGALDYT